ncbi:MAG: 2,3-bisphosphoglycerate-independent phosphoglycerate mutase [Rickettsiales bacterium]|nr:2,3-bisphosphoglycerate-independent phosphoglycerate mutase [Rickettsiales bacterium]
MRKKPVVLCILDGWGIADNDKYSAIAKAKVPNYNSYLVNYPHSQLQASAEFVGLPEGQMGNSEVGHTNIGAGRVVMQTLPLINKDVANNAVKDRPVIKDMVKKMKASGKAMHLIGLMSDGGVHSHINHIINIAKVFGDNDIKVYLHLLTDGRDVAQKSALTFIKKLYDELDKGYPNMFIATVGGRYYGMDRDTRWDRVEKAYDAIVLGDCEERFKTAMDCIDAAYKKDITDEFIVPSAIRNYEGMEDGDGFLFCNFRADRARELTAALGDKNFAGFARKKVVKFSVMGELTEYSEDHAKYLTTVYTPDEIKQSLGEVISEAGLKQLRIAETEKYAHVTFFFNGGKETVFNGEERVLINSPKVATYDLQPEMSANGVKDGVLNAINSNKFDLIVINFANADMVGHTGIMEAAVKACEAVDKDIGEIVDAVKAKDGIIFITADHGNADKMFDETTGQPFTAHTTNPVPFIMIGNEVKSIKLADGALCDIAPTILKVMELKQPKEMTGKCLIK